jgi:transposase-like protein
MHDIWMAETKDEAEKTFDNALECYSAKYPKAMECLRKDREELLAFYDFPAEHWVHIRTTNPIESTFATVRLQKQKKQKKQKLWLQRYHTCNGIQTYGICTKEMVEDSRVQLINFGG